jgi:uncharacterized protein (UPF0218 family)
MGSVQRKQYWIPEKRKRSDCGDNVTISLMAHAAIVSLGIIDRGLERRVIGSDQFSFRRGK